MITLTYSSTERRGETSDPTPRPIKHSLAPSSSQRINTRTVRSNIQKPRLHPRVYAMHDPFARYLCVVPSPTFLHSTQASPFPHHPNYTSPIPCPPSALDIDTRVLPRKATTHPIGCGCMRCLCFCYSPFYFSFRLRACMAGLCVCVCGGWG